MKKGQNTVYLFCDGACRGNPGSGGWGVLLRYDGYDFQLYGSAANTTNNRMELTAAIEGFKALRHPCYVMAITDSQYLHRGVTEWLPLWKKRQWKTIGKKQVKNRALWEALESEVKRHVVCWQWVKGHSGHPENELADRLANRGIDEFLAQVKTADF